MARSYQYEDPLGFQRRVAYFCEAPFGLERYTNVVLEQATPVVVGRRTYYLSAVGLPFLARHYLVTLHFPKRTMCLKRSAVEPATDRSASQ